MRAHQPSFAEIWTWAAMLMVYALREAFENRIIPFLESLKQGAPTDAAMGRFVRNLLMGEAFLEKTFRNAVARALGLPIDRRPWRAFLRPMPRNKFRTLIACLRRYEHLLRYPERAVLRRIARIMLAVATTPLADLRADAAALALRTQPDSSFDLVEPSTASAALTPLAARPP